MDSITNPFTLGHGVAIERAALDLIVRDTHGFPYLVQELGKRQAGN